jgi:eukaryotic-like serine/threonine-protein kinase
MNAMDVVETTRQPDPRLQHRQIIRGRFRLDERLGDGAAGEVWRATDLDTGKAVAIKFPTTTANRQQDYVADALREASLARRVESPYVVHVTECALSLEVGPYIVMELLDGLDLFEHLARSGPLPLVDAAVIVAQLSLGLEALHANGIFHRDVKPENVVLTDREGHAYATLIDFGVARDAHDGCGSREKDQPAFSGTPAYMSPERLAGSLGVDVHGDLWSLAVVAYQCLVGGMPFDDRTLATIFVAVKGGIFTMPSALRDDIPPALDEWFRKAFAREPSARFASAREMREALIEACSPLPLHSGASRAVPACTHASGVRPRLVRLDDIEREAC